MLYMCTTTHLVDWHLFGLGSLFGNYPLGFLAVVGRIGRNLPGLALYVSYVIDAVAWHIPAARP